MARLWGLGFETGRVMSEPWPATTAPSFLNGSGDGTSTARSRGGNYSFLYNAAALQVRFAGGGGAAGTERFGRMCFNFESVPASAGPWIIKQSDPQLRITNTRALQLWFGSNVYTSAALNLDQWYVFEWYMQINAAAGVNDALTFKIDGTQVYTTSGSDMGATVSTNFDFGTSTAVTGLKYYIDDIAVNDTTGADQNSYPGLGRIELLKPMADTAVGTNWVRGDNTSGSMFQAVDTVPGAGLAAGTSSSQVRNAVATASNLDIACESYDEAGIPSGDSIVLARGLVRVGASATTGTNTGTARLLSNPDEGATFAIDYEGAGAAMGTDSGAVAGTSGWRTYLGSTVYAPSVTRATRPVMRLTRTTDGSTRQHCSDLMGVLVEHLTPPAGGDDWTQPVDDTAAGTDAITSRVVKGLTEGPTATDVMTKVAAFVRSIADPAAGTDAFTKRTTKALADPASVTDLIVTVAGKGQAIAESASVITDAFTKAPRKALADVGAGTDAFTKAPKKALADTAAGTDAFTKRVTLAISDTIAGTDARTRVITKGLADPASATDAQTRVWAAKLAPADTFAGTDAQAKTIRPVKADTGQFTDLATPDLGVGANDFELELGDALSVSDASSKGLTSLLGDAASVSDAVASVSGTTLALADGFAASDAIVKAFGRGIADLLSVTDAISPGLNPVLEPISDLPSSMLLEERVRTLALGDRSLTLLALADTTAELSLQTRDSATSPQDAHAGEVQLETRTLNLTLESKQRELTLDG